MNNWTFNLIILFTYAVFLGTTISPVIMDPKNLHACLLVNAVVLIYISVIFIWDWILRKILARYGGVNGTR